jgi:hypothetical protein
VEPTETRSQCGGQGSIPSAPPFNFFLFNHLQEPDKLEPKTIWRDIDVAATDFQCGTIYLYLDQYEKT